MPRQMLIVFIVVLIILTLVAAFDRVMDRWDRHMDIKQEQQVRMGPTIDLPQGVAIEIGRIDLNNITRTVTLHLHIKFEDKYYYTELILPTREVRTDGVN